MAWPEFRNCIAWRDGNEKVYPAESPPISTVANCFYFTGVPDMSFLEFHSE
jgi:hypothetical protein